ncbi:MAG: hypothetical protein AAF483_10085, partial [Planctomycetota bacterium]
MNRLATILLLVLTAFAGCIDGRQKGEFSVGGTESRALASCTGSLTTFTGQSLSRDHTPSGADRPLLHVLVVCPGFEANGSQSDIDHGAYESVYKQSWFADLTTSEVTIRLDRRNDLVEFNDEEFRRSEGNE